MGGLRETSFGGPGRRFPSTQWSIIVNARDAESPASREALNDLCRLYWKPVYTYLRAAKGLTNDEAKDLTQEFLIEVMEGPILQRYSPDRGSFRCFLQGAVRLFLRHTRQKAGALKRGGDRRILRLDGDEGSLLAALPAPADVSPDDLFDRQWAQSVVDHASADLQRELAAADRGTYFKIFDRYELHPPPSGRPSHEELAQQFGMKRADICNHLMYCRKRYRKLLVDLVRGYVSNRDELDAEMAHIIRLLAHPLS